MSDVPVARPLKYSHHLTLHNYVSLFWFCSHVQVAQFIANLGFTVNIFTSGFILNLTSINPVVRWLDNISFVRWSIQGMADMQFRDIRFSCDDAPSLNATCIKTGSEALRFYALDKYTSVDSWYILGGMFLWLNVCAILLLKLRSQRPEQI